MEPDKSVMEVNIYSQINIYLHFPDPARTYSLAITTSWKRQNVAR